MITVRNKESKVSILILTCNALPYTKFCMTGLFRYTKIPFELLILDNGSSDGTPAFLKKLRAKVILNPRNQGVSQARQQLFALVKTKYFCSMDNDIYVSEGWLEGLLNVCKENPQMKAVAPIRYSHKFKHPVNGANSRDFWEEIKRENHQDFPKDQLQKFTIIPYDKFVEKFKKKNKVGEQVLECPPDFLGGWCFLGETEAFRKTGGLADPFFQGFGMEDVDASWRLAVLGFQLARTDRSFVHHFEHSSVNKSRMDFQKRLGENKIRFAKKWHRFFWNFLDQKLKVGMPIEEIMIKYWIYGRVLPWLPKQLYPKGLEYLFGQVGKAQIDHLGAI